MLKGALVVVPNISSMHLSLRVLRVAPNLGSQCYAESSALRALLNRRQSRQCTAQPKAVQCFAEGRADSALRNRRQCTAQPKAMQAVHRPIRGSAVQKEKKRRQCTAPIRRSAL